MTDRGGQTLETFFGCPLQRVNKMILLIAADHKPPPEWMRGRPQLEQLPRYTPKGRHAVAHGVISHKQIVARLKWIVEEQHGGWCYDQRGFIFEDEIDAIHYKMVWD